jgi:hypothetical protein
MPAALRDKIYPSAWDLDTIFNVVFWGWMVVLTLGSFVGSCVYGLPAPNVVKFLVAAILIIPPIAFILAPLAFVLALVSGLLVLLVMSCVPAWREAIL